MPDDFGEGTVFMTSKNSWQKHMIWNNEAYLRHDFRNHQNENTQKKRTILSSSKNNCDIFTIFKVAQYHAFDIYLMINNVATYVSRISSLITFCVNGL